MWLVGVPFLPGTPANLALGQGCLQVLSPAGIRFPKEVLSSVQWSWHLVMWFGGSWVERAGSAQQKLGLAQVYPLGFATSSTIFKPQTEKFHDQDFNQRSRRWLG